MADLKPPPGREENPPPEPGGAWPDRLLRQLLPEAARRGTPTRQALLLRAALLWAFITAGILIYLSWVMPRMGMESTLPIRSAALIITLALALFLNNRLESCRQRRKKPPPPPTPRKGRKTP